MFSVEMAYIKCKKLKYHEYMITKNRLRKHENLKHFHWEFYRFFKIAVVFKDLIYVSSINTDLLSKYWNVKNIHTQFTILQKLSIKSSVRNVKT